MMKRFMSLLLSVVMAVGLCVPVSAEAGGGLTAAAHISAAASAA